MNQEILVSTGEVSSDLAHADAFGSPEDFAEALDHLMESARAAALAKRRKQVQELLNSFSNTTAATLTLGEDGTASECTICKEDLSQVRQTVVQLPCHPSNLFHRDCIKNRTQAALYADLDSNYHLRRTRNPLVKLAERHSSVVSFSSTNV
ncbi:hypothetical protein PTTG_28227 [Puccinia triticina 1-1 BBBD Race 1]|uniref:RING-type domain-containing protein n=2 Tax=Puccinia triticina TaxID=208348 RepID=A0A180GDQ7_PUCT1|nr:uncharacterized protein PtA15_4A468 [Puccinia triticina]OAV90669.1 hypothetical protein PTTG_28227 [Puccinia triticina 1-1 BBBD Race 1]WAQ84017.1 hypothetical protein PtA15_4A468 [Puccinia triticina]WAR54862.1 hypothetical protein PtB15_4B480 [Puccinia triticina]